MIDNTDGIKNENRYKKISDRGVDLTDKQFGEWTVLGYIGKKQWECRCSCGTVKVIKGSELKSGRSKSCGHIRNSLGDLTGKQFGEWFVISKSDKSRYECRCSCGKIGSVSATDLVSGKSKSCGHTRVKYNKFEIIGRQFGDWTVTGKCKEGYDCLCSCGNKGIVSITDLISGKSKSCGHNTNNLIDISGRQFGEWIVIKHEGYGRWLCRCSCGTEKILRHTELINGDTTSCGCKRKEKLKNTLLNKRTEIVGEYKLAMNNTRINLEGKQFGDWEVLYYAGNGYWHCKCSCGEERDVLGRSLRTGKSVSCGHIKIKNSIEIGDKFGEWTVLEYRGEGKYLCRCSCNKEKIVKSAHLLSGASKSCGHNTTGFKDLTGAKFGDWTVLGYAGNRMWKCKCICDRVKEVSSYSLTSGLSTNCGCKNQNHLEGMIVGELTVLEKSKHNSGFWVCKCSCGNIVEIRAGSLINKKIRSCGCKTLEFKRKTMIEKYGDIAVSRIGNPRDIDIQEACQDRDKLLSLINEVKINVGHKPSLADMVNRMDMGEKSILYHLRQLNLESEVKIGTFGAMQNELVNLIKSYNLNIICNDRKELDGLELDIFIPDKKIAIEFNGTYWHSSEYKDIEYHQRKTIQCAKKGIRLIHIFEYEWTNENKRQLIISYLESVFNINIKRIYARNTKLMEISYMDAAKFENENHLQGEAKSLINFGLFYNEDLIAVMTFGRPRFNNKYEYELVRLAYKKGIAVTGGAEKLFKGFLRTYNPVSIISYCDIAKFTGNVYTRLGFNTSQNDITDPNYVWVCKHNEKIYKRYQTQKHKLLKLGLGDYGNTENEIMTNLGYVKIYDSGNLRFTWSRK